MKTKLFLLLSFLTFSVTKAQVADITGTWTMFEMTYVTDQGNQVTTEEQMKANGSLTDYFFMPEGKFKMTSNMSGSGTMDTYEGTWKLGANELTYSLNINGQSMDIVWKFELKDEVMKLSRTNPEGTFTIVNSFRRKKA
jgi:hypothetical protein